ncbi:UNVERIFIED_CONTAM: GC-rich sequence DNA-binding factor 2 [Siphonaria sp. JEL0065]|nr:GC-rich sequence DNA-binding factor 2 [Siphonaria sp. JEL0065]
MFKPKKKSAVKTRIRSFTNDEDDDEDTNLNTNTNTNANANANANAKKAANRVFNQNEEVDGDQETDAATLALLAKKKIKARRLGLAASSSLLLKQPASTRSSNVEFDSDNPYSPANLKRLAQEQKALPRAFVGVDADVDVAANTDDIELVVDLAQSHQSTDSTKIWDPAEIHALKKLREEKRNRKDRRAETNDENEENASANGHDADFISLGGSTVRVLSSLLSRTVLGCLPIDSLSLFLQKQKKYESRLVTEDQEEDEPEAFEAHEGDRIMFGNKTAEQLKLDRKKTIQSHLMDMDEEDGGGSNDEEDDEESRLWQDEQIRLASNGFASKKKKNNSGRKSNPYDDDELDGIRGYNEFAMPTSTPLVPATDVLKSLTVSLSNLDLEIKQNSHTLASTESIRVSSESHIKTLQGDIQSASKRYTYYQELVGKWSSFADLLDAKMPLFEGLVESLVACGMDRKKEKESIRLEEVESSLKSTGDDGVIAVDAFGREINSTSHGKALVNAEAVDSFVKTETQIASVLVRELNARIDEISDKRDLLLSDVSEEYKDIRQVLQLFANWKSEYRADYVRSYAGLTVHQAVFPFVKMQLADWDPFAINAPKLQDMDWHNLLTETSGFDEIEGNDEPSDPLIFLVVKKAVFPHVKKLIPTIDLFSHESVSRTVALFYTLEEYSSRKSVAFKGLVDTLTAHVEQTVSGLLKSYPTDLTQAISGPPSVTKFGREGIFWHIYKLYKNLFSLRSVIAKDGLQTLLIDTILNQYLLVFLNGPMGTSDDILKYEMLASAVPGDWIKSSPKLLAVLERQVKWFAVNVVDREKERGVLDRVSVLLM